MNLLLKNIRFVFLLLIVFSSTFLFSDYSFFTNWKYIESEQFKVVYIEGNDKAAQRVLNTFETVYPHLIKTIPVKKEKFTIFLKNEGTISNGFVTPYNARSEFFQTPSQDNFFGTNSFLDELVVHEGRHVIQMRKANHGFTYLTSLFGGQRLQAAFSFWSIPDWVMEGDAVNIETALTNSGRGRLPSFTMGLKALILEKKKDYTFTEIDMPSYKFYKPNHYVYGHLMMAYIKKKYGSKIPVRTLLRSSWFSFVPFAYSMSLKGLVNENEDSIYYSTIKEMKKLWQEQIKKISITDAKILNERKEDYISYRYPQYSDDGCIIAQKSSFSNLRQIVKICSLEEKIISEKFTNPYLTSFSLNKNLITYSDFVPDLRFHEMMAGKSNSEVGYYDMTKKELVSFDKYKRLFAPVISKSMKYLATIRQSKNNKSSLMIFDLNTKKLIKEIKPNQNEFWQNPKWAKDEDVIYLTAIHSFSKGKAMLKIDIDLEKITTILPYGNINFYSPIKHGNYIFYSAEYSGIDNIYAYDISKKKIFQVTSRKYGAFFPDVSSDGKRLLFSDYTSNGYQVAEMKLLPKKWIPLEKIRKVHINYYEPLVKQEAGGDVLKNVSNNSYEVKNYTGIDSLFNFHSWGLNGVIDKNNLPLVLISENALNNIEFILNYNYSRIMNVHYSNVQISYMGFYPKVGFAGGYGYQSSAYKIDVNGRIIINDDSLDNNSENSLSWRQKDFSSSLAIPLNFSRFNYTQMLNLQVSYWMIQSDLFQFNNSDLFFQNQFLEKKNTFFYKLDYIFQKKKAIRDFNPQWGIHLFSEMKHDIYNIVDKNKNLKVTTNLFLPGIFVNHSLFFELAYENNFNQSYLTNLGRGYYNIENNRSHYIVSANYSLPISYEQVNLFYILFLNRLIVNLFFDYSRIPDNTSNTDFSNKEFLSTGVEVNIETYFFSKKFFRLFQFIRISNLLNQEYVEKVNDNKKISIEYLIKFSYTFDDYY